MRLLKVAAAIVFLFAIVLSVFVATARADLADVTIGVTPGTVDLSLGETTPIEVVVTNNNGFRVEGVVAHIDITALDGSGSVDPEDWSNTLSRSVGTLDPGQSKSLSWELQPISPGTFTLYSVALAPGSQVVAVSETLTISVADRRSLNPNGILPIAIGAPVIVGGALAFQMRRGRSSLG